MKKGKRFTPALLRAFNKLGRCTGEGPDYTGWHRVTRRDPPSRGASGWMQYPDADRMSDYLAQGEEVAQVCGRIAPGYVDGKENFRLSLYPHEGDFAEARRTGTVFPGTVQIASELGIRHPIVTKDGDRELWVMSTDYVLTDLEPNGRHRTVPVSVKPAAALSKRDRQLALIEKTYWSSQGCQWLLITPELYPAGVFDAYRRYAGYVVNERRRCGADLKRVAECVQAAMPLNLTAALRVIQEYWTCTHEEAQTLFWQSAMTGALMIDLAETRWPTNVLRLLAKGAYWRQNPIVSRRSSWR